MASSVGDALLNITLDKGQVGRAITDAMRANEGTIAGEGKKLSKSLNDGVSGGLTGFQKLGAGVTGVGALVAVVSAKMALDFESSLTSIKALTGSSTADIELYRKSILSLSGEVAQSPKQLAEALYFVSSAGFAGKEAIDVLTVSAQAAAAGLTDTKVVADAVTSAMNAYGHENLTARSATDILTQSVTDGKAEFGAIAGAIGQVAGVAAASGVKFSELGAAMAGLTSIGISADEAATTIKSTLIALEAPSAKVIDLLSKMGISADSVRQSIRDKGLISTIQDLGVRLHGNVGDLLELIPNHRTLALVLGATGAQAQQYNDILGRMSHASDGAGATARAFAERQKDVKFQLQQVGAELQALAVSFGEKLIPLIRGALGVSREIVGFFDDNQIAAAALAVVIGGPLVAAMAAFTIAEARLVAGKILGFWLSAADAVRGLQSILIGASRELYAFASAEGTATAAGSALLLVVAPLALAVAGAAAGYAIWSYWLERVQGINQKLIDSQATATNNAALAASKAKESTKITQDQAVAAYENAVALNHQTDVMKGAATYSDAMASTQRAATQTLKDMSAATHVSADKIVELANAMGINLGKMTDQGREKLNAALADWKHSVDSVAAATEVLGGKADQLGGHIQSSAEKMKAAKQAAQELKDGLDILIGVHVNAGRAAIDYENKVAALTQSFIDNKTTLDIHTDAGRKNLTAVFDLIDATTKQVTSMREEGKSTEEVNAVMAAHRLQLEQVMSQAGFTKDQIAALEQQYGLIPPVVHTDVTANTSQAVAALSGIAAQIAYVQRLAAQSIDINPGYVYGQGQAKRMGIGGIVDTPTLTWVGERNKREVVIPMDDKARATQLAVESGLMDLLSGDSGGSTGSSPAAAGAAPVLVSGDVYIDGKKADGSFVQFRAASDRQYRRSRQ